MPLVNRENWWKRQQKMDSATGLRGALYDVTRAVLEKRQRNAANAAHRKNSPGPKTEEMIGSLNKIQQDRAKQATTKAMKKFRSGK